MSNGLVIFNPQEKEVLLYSLYNDYPQLREIIEGLITQFEQADYSKKIVVENNGKKGIDLFLLDKEELFPPLANIFAFLDNKQKEFLEFVLSKYIETGVDELEQEKLPELLKLKYHALEDATQVLGGVEKIQKTFIGFQKYLYEKKAA